MVKEAPKEEPEELHPGEIFQVLPKSNENKAIIATFEICIDLVLRSTSTADHFRRTRENLSVISIARLSGDGKKNLTSESLRYGKFLIPKAVHTHPE
jgi:hypothetical protein